MYGTITRSKSSIIHGERVKVVLKFGAGWGFGFDQSRRADIGVDQRTRVETATTVVSADGTGDYETIQEAIDTISNSGGYIQIKEGTYTINSTITIPGNITIVGSGQKTKILASGITTMVSITGDDVKLEKIFFEGENTSDDGISIGNVEDITVQGCFFKTLSSAIILGSVSAYCMIHGNKFEELTTAIEIDGEYSSIYGNIFNFNTSGTNMIKSNGADFISITGNAGFGSVGYSGHASDYKVQITGNNFSEDGSITLLGDNCICVGNVTGTITDSGSSSIVKENEGGDALGHMYQHDTGTTVTISTIAVPVIVGGFSGGQTNYVTFQNSQELKIIRPGRYKVEWQCSFTAGASNQEIEGAIGINGTFQTSSTGHRKIGTGTDTGSMSGTTILNLSKDDLVQLMLLNETSTNNLGVEHAQVNVFKL